MPITYNFETADVPSARRSSSFLQAMSNWFSVPLAVKSNPAEELCIRMRGFSCRGVAGAELSFSPHFTAPVGGRPRSDRLLITMQIEGNSMFAQDGRECTLAPGILTLIDPSRPFAAETGNMRCISLYLARSSIQALLPHYDDYTARPIRIAEGPGAILTRVARDLIDLPSTINEEQLQLMAETLPNFAVAALKSESVPTGPMPARHKLSQLHRVRQFIGENLTNPQLSPQLVSQHLKISTRQIHELFSSEKATLMREVTMRRLQNCQRDLADPMLAERSISEIGRDWGFNDPTRFSKAFRTQYGTSPRTFRKRSSRASSKLAS